MSIESVLAPRLDGTMVHGAGSMRERLARWRGLPEADLQAAPGMAGSSSSTWNRPDSIRASTGWAQLAR
jgi:hypothetical protein